MPAQYGLGADAPKRGLRWLYLPFMLLMGMGSMALATQRIAAVFNYSLALGEPWGMAGGILWYAPGSIFTWQEQFVSADPYGFMEQVGTFSGVNILNPLKEYPWGQRAVRFYDPDHHIIEVGESMKVVVKRFLRSGLSIDETMERSMFPRVFVEMCNAELQV